MDLYEGNTKIGKNDRASNRQHIQTVGGGQIVKKNGLQKLADNLSEDSSSIKDYVKDEVLFPAIADVLGSIVDCVGDVLRSYVDLALFKEVRPTTRTYRKNKKTQQGFTGAVSYINYNDMSKPKQSYAVPTVKMPSVSDIQFNDYGTAQLVLSKCFEYLNQYERGVSVADFFETSQVPVPTPACYNYGWKSLESAEIVGSTRNGYRIRLSRPIELD